MFVAEETAIALITALRGPLEEMRRHDSDLAAQSRRAASSIALNIGEGAARIGRDQAHHYRIARGSARELRVALRVAVGWGHVTPAALSASTALLDRLLGLLWGMTRT